MIYGMGSLVQPSSEAESRILGARAWALGGDRASVGEVERVLGMDGGDGCITMESNASELHTVKCLKC